jgi:hypothetical protein
LRAAAYPPIGDQLDAIMKLADQLMRDRVAVPEEVRVWVEQCKAVKAKYKRGSE